MKQTNTSNSVDGFKGVWQMWHQKGQLCPKGTVPTRRSTLKDVLRAKSLYYFGKKPAKLSPLAARDRGGAATPSPDITGGNGHEVCLILSSSF